MCVAVKEGGGISSIIKKTVDADKNYLDMSITHVHHAECAWREVISQAPKIKEVANAWNEI